MFTGWDRPSHWLVLAIVVVILFGYKKLPDMTRSVGKSLRIFKTEMKGMTDDDAARDGAAKPPPPEAPAPPRSVNAEQAVPPNAGEAGNRQTTPQSPPATPSQPPTAE
jgi:sec-independent protein translocase protein TatA